jgi:peptidyl-prolyl cis-trans isomerase C
VVGPIAVEGGVALVRIEDVRAEQPIPLEAARPQIVRFLTYDRVRDILEKLRAKAKVETLIKPEPGAPKAVPPADAPKVAPGPSPLPVAPVQPPSKGASK